MKIVSWLSIFLTLIVMAIAWSWLPEGAMVPIHWNLNGEPDSFTNKWTAFAIFPLVQLGLLALRAWLPAIEPRKDNMHGSKQGYSLMFTALILAMFALQVVTLAATLKWISEPASAILLCISLLLMALGNYLSRVRSNFFIGIRTPWTLSNEQVWYQTHRLGSKLFVAAGCIGILATLLPVTIGFRVFLVAIVIAALIPVVYSWFIYKKETA